MVITYKISITRTVHITISYGLSQISIASVIPAMTLERTASHGFPRVTGIIVITGTIDGTAFNIFTRVTNTITTGTVINSTIL
jgi:hypothetical protein